MGDAMLDTLASYTKILNEPQTWEEALDICLDEMREIMIDRHKKYGPKNILALGIKGVLDRGIHDKGQRLLTHYKPIWAREELINYGIPEEKIERLLAEHMPMPDEFADETIEDAHYDFANYVGPICLMLRRGWWELPMGENAR